MGLKQPFLCVFLGRFIKMIKVLKKIRFCLIIIIFSTALWMLKMFASKEIEMNVTGCGRAELFSCFMQRIA